MSCVQGGLYHQYGSSLLTRPSVLFQVVQAVVDEVGADRVGLRLAPFVGTHQIYDDHTYALNVYLLEELNKLDIAYVHCVEPRDGGSLASSPCI